MQVGPTKKTDNLARAIVWVVLISVGGSLVLFPNNAFSETLEESVLQEETLEERQEWVKQLIAKDKVTWFKPWTWSKGSSGLTPCRQHPATYNRGTGLYSCVRRNKTIWAGEGMTQRDLIIACCGRGALR